MSGLDNLQPRYRAYCIANGASSKDEMWARDGNGVPYILWISGKWEEWDKLVGHNGKVHSEEDHAAFDTWLSESVLRERKAA